MRVVNVRVNRLDIHSSLRVHESLALEIIPHVSILLEGVNSFVKIAIIRLEHALGFEEHVDVPLLLLLSLTIFI